VRFVSSLFVRYRPRRGLPESKALTPYRAPHGKPPAASLLGAFSLPRVIEQAEELGFRYLGQYEYAGLFGYIPRDAWVSTDGHVRLSGRRGNASGVEAAMSPYILTTMFDDGTAIVTWGQSPTPIPSSERVTSQGGTGDLAADMRTHEALVASRLLADETGSVSILAAESLEDATEMSKYFDIYVTNLDVQWRILTTRAFVYGSLVALVAFVVKWVIAISR